MQQQEAKQVRKNIGGQLFFPSCCNWFYRGFGDCGLILMSLDNVQILISFLHCSRLEKQCPKMLLLTHICADIQPKFTHFQSKFAHFQSKIGRNSSFLNTVRRCFSLFIGFSQLDQVPHSQQGFQRGFPEPRKTGVPGQFRV